MVADEFEVEVQQALVEVSGNPEQQTSTELLQLKNSNMD